MPTTLSRRYKSRSRAGRAFSNRRRFAFEPLEERNLLSHAPGLGYSFQPVAFLGDPAPGGGEFVNDFEPSGINNRGEVAFVADVSTCDGGFGFCEGNFRGSPGHLSQIQRTGQPAPGADTLFAPFGFTQSVNDHGDVATTWLVTLPSGISSAVYRYSNSTGAVTPVVVPFVTPAPTGGDFQSAGGGGGGLGGPDINNRGDIVFSGVIVTDDGVHTPGLPYFGLGIGVFREENGQITNVASPGDAAPGGGTFDATDSPSINDTGDVAFVGHEAGEECRNFPEPQEIIYCWASSGVYLKEHATGEVRLVSSPDDPALGGRFFPFYTAINNRGDVAFQASELNPDGWFIRQGIFLSSQGTTVPVAVPGDLMPGGGHIVTTSTIVNSFGLNNPGDVTFDAVLDTDDNGDGLPDTGLYTWSDGSAHLVARTGTVIPGVGTIAHVNWPFLPGLVNSQGIPLVASGAKSNDHRQVLYTAVLQDGTVALLLATPTGEAAGSASASSSSRGNVVVVTRGLQTASPSSRAPSTSDEASAPLAGQPPASAMTNPSTPLPPQPPPFPVQASSDHAFADPEDFLLDEALLNDLAAGLLG